LDEATKTAMVQQVAGAIRENVARVIVGKEAVAEHGKRVSLIAEGRYLDVKKDYKTTMVELLKKYEENFQQQASFDRTKCFWLENFKNHFGEHTLGKSGYSMLHRR